MSPSETIDTDRLLPVVVSVRFVENPAHPQRRRFFRHSLGPATFL
jgi:hypothetical protein